MGVHSSKRRWWNRNAKKVFSHFCKIGSALQQQADFFSKLFFLGFKAGYNRGAKFTVRGEYKDCPRYAEAKEKFLAAGRSFDSSKEAVLTLLACSKTPPIAEISSPFPADFH